jgi:tetratricopeptide (TPR) repeat protein
MIDLTRASAGVLEPGSWFSDLLAGAIQCRFTGGVLVKTPGGDVCAFFREGQVVHCGGPGFTSHFLGEFLVQQGLVSPEALGRLVEEQVQAGASRPLLGALLVAQAGLDPAEVKRAVQAQNEARVAWMASIGEGSWQAAPGENARIRDIGVITEAWPIFYRVLGRSMAERELRLLADRLLGRAVKLSQPVSALPGLEDMPKELSTLLAYLDKPRKPDQLERALGDRRRARGLLRALEIFGLLETRPVAEAIPIPSATLLKGQGFPVAPGPGPAARATDPVGPAPSGARETPRTVSRLSSSDQALVREVKELHKDLAHKNYFELLGAKEDTPASELRRLYTLLAKKYHPDAFPAHVPQEVQDMARDISARLNEAYQTVTHEKSRAEYLTLLADTRFKGDARKAERAREAEMKGRMGAVMLRKKDFRRARELYRLAMDFDPDCGDYKAAYAWTLFADVSYDREEGPKKAREIMTEAVRLAPKNAQVHFWMGQILKNEDKLKEALHHFKAAHALDPKNVDAEREVRLIESRAKKDDPSKGGALAGLGKLLKRS